MGAVVRSLTMVDSSRAPAVLLRAMDSRTGTTAAVEVADGVVEVTVTKISPQ